MTKTLPFSLIKAKGRDQYDILARFNLDFFDLLMFCS